MKAPKFESPKPPTAEAEGFGLSETTLTGAQLRPIENHPAANDASGFADTVVDFSQFKIKPDFENDAPTAPTHSYREIASIHDVRAARDAAGATFRPTSSNSEPNPAVMTELMKGAPEMEVDGLRPPKIEQPPIPGETQVDYDDKLSMVVKRTERPSFLRRLFGMK